jgi:putative SOS response-associated peptidase YedK
MCGRFVLYTPGKDVAEHFGCSDPFTLEPKYNIAPTQLIVAIRAPTPERKEMCLLRWGLVPFWAKDEKTFFINARSETLREKPAFREPFKTRRCLIPANAFYEWKKIGKNSYPHVFMMKNKGLFAIPGLWEERNDSLGNRLLSCTILTTEANELVSEIHDRMPVIIEASDYDLWLNVKTPLDTLGEIMKAYPAELMQGFPVGDMVNKTSFDSPECMRPTCKLF